jgi:CheY-like chemotaxis protein
MSDFIYTVLWADDEHSDLQFVKDQASEKDIELVCVESAEEAIQKLESGVHYDAVILDGLLHRKINEKGSPSKETAFGDIASRLTELKGSGRIIPWFILSGQTRFTQEQNTMVDVFAKNSHAPGVVFNKSKPADLVRLWLEIINAAEQQPETILRHKYHRALEMCTDAYLGTDIRETLIEALKKKDESSSGRSKDYFNPIRKILENLFKKLNKIGLIPDDKYRKTDPKGNWGINYNGCCNFLIFDKKDLIHPTVIFLIRQLRDLTQDGSHGNADELKLKVDVFVKSNDTNYLYISTLHQLLDVLIWFKTFIDEHPISGRISSYR